MSLQYTSFRSRRRILEPDCVVHPIDDSVSYQNAAAADVAENLFAMLIVEANSAALVVVAADVDREISPKQQHKRRDSWEETNT